MVEILAALLLAVLLSACSSGAPKAGPAASQVTTAAPTAPTATSGGDTASTSGPCKGTAPPASYQHVVVILEENRGAESVMGSGSAPYVNKLGRQCGVATDYSAAAHPSLPNYIALTSGGTQGISDDAGPSSHRVGAPSIFSLLGAGWRSLEESMPTACDHSNHGNYAVRHNPAVYYTNIASQCVTQDVPMNDSAPDISARYTFITPDVCNDGHDCSTATADRWLSKEVPLILDSPEYQSGSTVLFITWDESDSGPNVVPLYVVAPSVVPGTRAAAPFDHYSLLRTSEELLGLSPLLGKAATAPSMRSAFHL